MRSPVGRRGARAVRARTLPFVLVIACVAWMGAAAALEQEPRGDTGFLRETAACLAAGLLLLAAADGAAAVGQSLRAPSGVSARRRLTRGAFRAAGRAAALVALGVPVLVAGWESGASHPGALELGAGLLACAVVGFAAGSAMTALGAGSAASVPIGASVGAVLLWPASLGWSNAAEGLRPGNASSFPAPQFSPVAIVVLVLVLLLMAATAVGSRLGRGRSVS